MGHAIHVVVKGLGPAHLAVELTEVVQLEGVLELTARAQLCTALFGVASAGCTSEAWSKMACHAIEVAAHTGCGRRVERVGIGLRKGLGRVATIVLDTTRKIVDRLAFTTSPSVEHVVLEHHANHSTHFGEGSKLLWRAHSLVANVRRVELCEQGVAGGQRIAAWAQLLHQSDGVVERPCRHVVDVDDHSLVHHLLDQDLAEWEDPELVAACGLRVQGNEGGLETEQAGKCLLVGSLFPEPERVPFVGAVPCVVPVALDEAIAHFDHALPGGGPAECVVEVVHRKHMADAPVIVVVVHLGAYPLLRRQARAFGPPA